MGFRVRLVDNFGNWRTNWPAKRRTAHVTERSLKNVRLDQLRDSSFRKSDDSRRSHKVSALLERRPRAYSIQGRVLLRLLVAW